jgi:hypothetical protein
MPKLYYLQAPNFSINADSEVAPRLGTIFYSLNRLTAPLNQVDVLEIPASQMNISATTNFADGVKKGIMGGVGLNANLAQGIAGSVDVIYGFAKDRTSTYHCELLETEEFEPTKEYIFNSIKASSRVQSALRDALPGRKRVYMITGVKIATGLSTTTSTETQHGPILRVGVNATALGVPVEAGPIVEFATTNARTISHGRSLNRVIFAYRVIRIKQKGDGEVKWTYKSGGLYSLDSNKSNEDEEPWLVECMEKDNMSKEFPDAVSMEVM